MVCICMYTDFFISYSFSVEGLSRAHCIRLVANESDPSKVDCHYMEDYSEKEGWFPRPAPLIRSKVWDEIFLHPEDPMRHGIPLSCEAFPIVDKGKRQQWQYNVKYARGDVCRFVLPCPSLPIDLSREQILSKVGSAERQVHS